MDMKSISQKLQDDIRAIMEATLHPNQQKIDVHEPEKDKITAHDFKKLRAMKKEKSMKEDADWVIIEQDEDNTTAKVAGHKVTLHRSLSEPGTSDTYTLHHPSGDKKVKISYGTHGDGEEVHGEKVNQAFGLDSKHKLGHKIAGSMSGMGGISKFEESVEQTNEEEKKKPVSPFDYKNYTSQIPKKPGELTGHDSKKTSTGTVYTKRPVKENTDIEEARKDKPLTLFKKDKRTYHPPKEESHQAATTMKHIPNASPALKKAAKDIKPGIAGYRDRIAMLKAGGVKEEVEELDELSMQTMKSAKEKLTSKAYSAHMDDDKRAARNLAGRALAVGAGMNRRARQVAKEEVEELDELSKTTLGSYAKKATRDAVITRKIGADFEHQGKRAKSPGMKAASDELSQKYKSKSWQRRDGVDKAVDRLTKEEIELGEAKSLHKMSAGELDQAHKDNEAKIAAIHKNDSSERITKSHPLIFKRRSINLHKVIRSKQSNPNYILPKAHGYNEEVEQDVVEGWDDMLKANKERAVAADKAKGTGKFDKKELSPGSTQYTRKSKTFTDGGSDADLRKANRKSNEEVDETTVIHNSFTVNLKEAYTFGEYLQAAKSIVGEDEAVIMANKAFGAQDVGIFEQAITIENMIEEMNTLQEAGHSISEPKYNTELGNPYYEYTVTEETGARRKYIHHGDVVTN